MPVTIDSSPSPAPLMFTATESGSHSAPRACLVESSGHETQASARKRVSYRLELAKRPDDGRRRAKPVLASTTSQVPSPRDHPPSSAQANCTTEP
ncbi:hypothetical protein VTN77DRAFT_9541 [Rasamsonia byssochlamydoides]|uniref:uncharacterized protein n=1 Tax=Rasamsonia byssochlamydoides TaxID=89139 RepID=UPI0037426C4B